MDLFIKIYSRLITKGIKDKMDKIKELLGKVRDLLDDMLWELPEWLWRVGFFAMGYVSALFFN